MGVVGAAPTTAAEPGGVYWIGADGNTWTKDSMSGVQNMGPASGNNLLSSYYRQIADPNPPQHPNPPQQTDPYAKWGGRGAYNAKIAAFNSQKQGVFDTANEAIGATGRNLNSSILDFLDQYKQGQNSVNEKAITADQAKMQGSRDITSMVGRGIRSAGSMLANKNASDSSAADGIARAYGDIGQREMSKVGGQYADAQRGIMSDQTALQNSAAQFNRHYGEDKTNAIEGIVTSARNSLAALDAQIADASLPDRIAIEQEKERIRGEALNSLSQYDQTLSSGVAAVKSLTPEQRMAQAAQRSTQGVDLGSNAFQYDSQAPAQFQNTGPYASNLPLFTLPGRRKEV